MPIRLWICIPILGGCYSQTKAITEPSFEGQVLSDGDGDGFLTDEDCDDENPSVNPGEVELCDGIDNNCDGDIDEGVGANFYLDSDGDGFGNEEVIIEACEVPDGYVLNANDCDDSFAEVYPGMRPGAKR